MNTKTYIYGGSGLVILLLAVWFFVTNDIRKLRKAITSTAKKYIGQSEYGDNAGFNDKSFQDKMTSVKWWVGAPWCMFFGKLIYNESLPETHKDLSQKLITGSTQETLRNFKNDKSGLFKVSNKASVGSLVIWQSKTDNSKGHAGIVTDVNGTTFTTIEGNKGNKVAQVTRSTAKIPSNWTLKGFIKVA